MRMLLLVFTLSLVGCAVEPEPLAYGTDSCHNCKMTLMDKKFGAELVTTKGKVYKFDDINCMLSFYNSGSVRKEEYEHKLVIDFSQPGKFINVEKAYFFKSDEIKSPMASGVAAFETKTPESAEAWKAFSTVSWNDIQKQFGE